MIPKVIHYCWFGNGELPLKVKKCIASWKKYCPEYKIIRWDESNYDYKKNLYMLKAYENRKWGFVSDYAKLDILYCNGGLFFDTDVEIIKPFDDLLENDCFMGFENHYVAPGLVIAARPGIPELKELMNMYDSLKFQNEDGSLNMVPSPRYTTEFFMTKGLKPKGEKQKIGNVTIYPPEYFCPKNMLTGECNITKNTYSIHHYDASWWGEEERREFDKQARLRKKSRWLWRLKNGLKVWKEEGLMSLIRKIANMKNTEEKA